MTNPTIIAVTGNPIEAYISYTDAETYFASRFDSDIWDDATETNQKKALIAASKKLNLLRYKGYKAENDQTLEFPRYLHPNYLSKHTYTDAINLVSINGKQFIYLDIPTELEEACCEEAITLLEFASDVHLKNQLLGIKSVKIGGESAEYTPTNTELLSPTALKLVDKYLQKVGKVV